MRKLPNKYENPIDNLIYLFVPKTSKLLDNYTPNFITTLSFISAILCLHFIYKNKIELGILFYFLSYYFDCVDGFHARRKNMCTKFGDYYDHITDIIIQILLAIFIFKKIKNYKYKNIIISTIIILAIFMYIHLSLQELYYNKNDSDFLNIFQFKNTIYTKYLPISRYFGSGTFTTFIIFIIYYTKYL